MRTEGKIQPSILSANHGAIWHDLHKLLVKVPAIEWLHFDVMDGRFVPNVSFGPQLLGDLKSLAAVENLPMPKWHVHLMVERPRDFLDRFIGCGADMISVHVECSDAVDSLLDHLRERAVEASLAINPESDLDLARPFLARIDSLLLMAVNPGFGGQKFLAPTLKKIETAVKLREQGQHHFTIGIDGGIDDDSVEWVARAGCDFVVAGSALFQTPDSGDAFGRLQKNFCDAALTCQAQ